MSSPTWGDPLWGDTAFVDPSTGSGSSTGGGTGGSGGGATGPHLYYRIHITDANIGNNTIGTAGVSIAEAVFYDSSNAVISTSGGTASASSEDGLGFFAASKAFDGSTSTFWNSDGMTAGVPEWLQMQFPSPVAVDHFSLSYGGGTGRQAPGNFSLQCSDDGSAWTTVYSYRGAMRITGAYTNTFYTSGIVYRLYVTAVQGGSGTPIFSDLKFYDPSNTLITSVLGNGFASSWDGGVTGDAADPTQAYNLGCGSYFASVTAGTVSTGSPEWIAFQFPSGTSAVSSFSFESANATGGVARAPVAFTLQSSFDGENFADIVSGTAAAWTSTCQTQTFTTGVTGGLASITINPAQGFDGSTYSVTVTGTGTHFVSGFTAVTISGAGATISSVAVISATSLTFTLALASDAVIGARTVTTATGAEAPTATFTILPVVVTGRKRGDIGWSQIREGLDGIWGFGPYGVATDGSFLAGDIPVVGPDGATLIGGGAGSPFTSSFLTQYVAATPMLDASGNPIVDSNGNWIFAG